MACRVLSREDPKLTGAGAGPPSDRRHYIAIVAAYKIGEPSLTRTTAGLRSRRLDPVGLETVGDWGTGSR